MGEGGARQNKDRGENWMYFRGFLESVTEKDVGPI